MLQEDWYDRKIEDDVESTYDLLNAGVVEGRVEVAAERREVFLH